MLKNQPHKLLRLGTHSNNVFGAAAYNAAIGNSFYGDIAAAVWETVRVEDLIYSLLS